jgi:hypothetical protein
MLLICSVSVSSVYFPKSACCGDARLRSLLSLCGGSNDGGDDASAPRRRYLHRKLLVDLLMKWLLSTMSQHE